MELTEFVIEEDVSSVSVSSFVKARQSQEYDIWQCSVIETEYLAAKQSVEGPLAMLREVFHRHCHCH
jgi:hypothetical protein